MDKDTVLEQLEQKIMEAYSAGDVEEVYGLVKEVLDVDPEIPEALLLLADVSSDEDEAREALSKARNLLITYEEDLLHPDTDEGQLFADILERLASLALADDAEQALALGRELEAFDPEDNFWARVFIYSSLLRLGRHSKVLEETLRDVSEDAPRFYSRALALFAISGLTDETMAALWDAFRIDPDIPFYMLAFWPEPSEGDSEEDREFYHLGSLLSIPWVENQEALAWLTSAAVSFGYLTGRLPEGFLDDMNEELKEAGMLSLFAELDSRIEALLEGEKDPEQEILDTKALEVLSGSGYLAGSPDGDN